MKFSCLLHLLPAFPFVLSPLAQGQTILDDHFDDGVLTGWKSVGNPLEADHTITEEGTLLTSTVVGTGANLNTNRGIVSDLSFDPASRSEGFTLTFEVTSQGETDPGANGLFLGLASSDEIFFRTSGVFSFGLVFYGLPSRTDSDNGVSLVTNDIGAGGPLAEGFILSANPETIDLSSLQDGFTAIMGANGDGWTFSVTGVNDLAGEPVEISDAGTWADAGTSYEATFSGAANWFVLASNQGNPSDPAHTVIYDRINLVYGQASATSPAISSITPSLTGENPTVTLTWDAIPEAEYAVEVTSDLASEVWIELSDSVTTAENEAMFVHEFLPNFPSLLEAGKLFYRIRLL